MDLELETLSLNITNLCVPYNHIDVYAKKYFHVTIRSTKASIFIANLIGNSIAVNGPEILQKKTKSIANAKCAQHRRRIKTPQKCSLFEDKSEFLLTLIVDPTQDERGEGARRKFVLQIKGFVCGLTSPCTNYLGRVRHVAVSLLCRNLSSQIAAKVFPDGLALRSTLHATNI